ncbi:PepSY domain-containing protein [Bacillus alkalicellulosilyticus]|uniref:PepSY domain-containing protein n=1 Tax=Alkalihalobacterium alkalicellulosilyticum TaxID=1912214 RepID=UPI001FE7B216|nr:PepSY domain-containing protein [Bacillus alkalicellulosilyticus]
MSVKTIVLTGVLVLGGIGMGVSALQKDEVQINEQMTESINEKEVVAAVIPEKLDQIAELDEDWYEDDDDTDSNSNSYGNIKITMEEAVTIALTKVEGKVKEVELDKDDGHYKYEIEIKTKDGREAEFEISAETGQILEFEWDD